MSKGAAARARRALRRMRHSHCDCAIQVRFVPDSSDACGASVSPPAAPKDAKDAQIDTVVYAHRAVLAETAYFARLFAHTEPVSVQSHSLADDVLENENRKDVENAACVSQGRVLRAVYSIGVPFAAAGMRALVDSLYSLDGIAWTPDSHVDPVDLVKGALFLGLPRDDQQDLIENIVDALVQQGAPPCLLAPLGPRALFHPPTDHRSDDNNNNKDAKGNMAIDDDEQQGDDGDTGTRDICVFLCHMVTGTLDGETKGALFARLFGTLAPTQQARVLALSTLGDALGHRAIYRPGVMGIEAGESWTDETGRRFRVVLASFDHTHMDQNLCMTMHVGDLEIRVIWTAGNASPTLHHDRHSITIQCAPHGEVLDDPTYNTDDPINSVPGGYVRTPLRMARCTLTTYHPTRGRRTIAGNPTGLYAQAKGADNGVRPDHMSYGKPVDDGWIVFPNSVLFTRRDSGVVLWRDVLLWRKDAICAHNDAGGFNTAAAYQVEILIEDVGF